MKKKLNGRNKDKIQHSVSLLIWILVSVYFISFTPKYLFMFVYKYWYMKTSSGKEISDRLHKADWVYLIRLGVHLIYYLHPVVNPYLYAFRTKDFREFKDNRLLKKSQVEIIEKSVRRDSLRNI